MSGIEVMWRRALHMRRSAVSVVGNVLVATERRRRLCRYDSATGEVLWDVGVGDARGVVVVGYGVVLYLDRKGTLSCFELDSGRRRWSVDGERSSGYLVLGDTFVLLGGWRGYRALGARDLATGSLLWRSDTDGDAGQCADLHWPFLSGDSVLVSVRGATVVDRIDPTSGKVLGRLQIPEPVASGDQEAAFVASPSGSVIFRVGPAGVVELDDNRVVPIWQEPADRGLGAPPSLIAGKLWTTVAGGITVLDPETHLAEIVEIRRGPAPGFGAVGNVVLVASRAGTVFALTPDGATVAQLRVSSKSSGLRQVSEASAVIAGKRELVGIHYSNH